MNEKLIFTAKRLPNDEVITIDGSQVEWYKIAGISSKLGWYEEIQLTTGETMTIARTGENDDLLDLLSAALSSDTIGRGIASDVTVETEDGSIFQINAARVATFVELDDAVELTFVSGKTLRVKPCVIDINTDEDILVKTVLSHFLHAER